MKALFFAADDGYRDPGLGGRISCRPAATASISGTGRASPTRSRRPASRTPRRSRASTGPSSGRPRRCSSCCRPALAWPAAYVRHHPTEAGSHGVGLPRNRQRPGAAGALERTRRRRSPPNDAYQAFFAGAFRRPASLPASWQPSPWQRSPWQRSPWPRSPWPRVSSQPLRGSLRLGRGGALGRGLRDRLDRLGRQQRQRPRPPRRRLCALVLHSAARAFPAAVWAPLALSALEAAIRALAAFCAAALPMVFVRPGSRPSRTIDRGLTLRVRRDLRRAAAFGWIAPTFAARSRALIASVSAACASTPSSGWSRRSGRS